MTESDQEVLTPTWRMMPMEVVSSTNDLAGKLPAWHVVTAKRQLQGRGRYRRTWVSDEGGIWLSAVLPTPGESEMWGVLPLAAGWALKETMASFGVAGMRLRWPNDLLISNGKLAGILVERFNPETAVIGIGINYQNAPASVQPELSGMVTRLVDLLDPLPSREEIIASLLTHMAIAQKRIESRKVTEFLPALNSAWQIDRVSISLHSQTKPLTGSFLGVDEHGRLRLRSEDGELLVLMPTDVELLRELR